MKISKIAATKCHIVRIKCTKFDFHWGSPQTLLGELTQSPLAALKKPTSKGRGRERKGREWKKKRGEGKG